MLGKTTITPIVRISRGRFSQERHDEVKELICKSEAVLAPALKELSGLLYYHAAVDRATDTVVNVSVWVSIEAAKQMDSMQAMLAQRPILEAAGVQFDPIANYEPLWNIQGDQVFIHGE